MRNYEYIVAGLPVLRSEDSSKAHFDVDAIIADIRYLLSDKDNRSVDFLLSVCKSTDLNADLYAKALKDRSRFIREYLRFDLNVRNTKVLYINKSLDRAEDMDMVILEGHELDKFEEKAKVDEVLYQNNILQRERGLDDLMWAKIDELTGMNIFTLDFILGFIAKLMIIDRWFKLNPETGKEMFRSLVQEIRSTYDNKKQNII